MKKVKVKEGNPDFGNDYICMECDSVVWGDEDFCPVCGGMLDWDNLIKKGDNE